MGLYSKLELRPVINADATLTRLGGSLMPPDVLDAMHEAAAAFIDLPEFLRAAGDRIAELTGNEAAYITSGAAAGLYLATIACGLTTSLEDGASLHERERRQVLYFASQRNAFLPSIELAGAELVPVEGADTEALEAQLSSKTVAIFFFAGSRFAAGAPDLSQIVDVARRWQIPVVVDAAAQIPPVDSLWKFTGELGAELAIFSGGKGLAGPQSSGFILGRRELIEVCRAHGAPITSRGRGMKVGKEEIAGLLAAVERYLALDHKALDRQYEAMVQLVIDNLQALPDVKVWRDWPNEAGQPIPRARIELGNRSASNIRQQLWNGDPRIAIGTDEDQALLFNPQTLNSGEERIVVERLLSVLNSPPLG